MDNAPHDDSALPGTWVDICVLRTVTRAMYGTARSALTPPRLGLACIWTGISGHAACAHRSIHHQSLVRLNLICPRATATTRVSSSHGHAQLCPMLCSQRGPWVRIPRRGAPPSQRPNPHRQRPPSEPCRANLTMPLAISEIYAVDLLDHPRQQQGSLHSSRG